MDRRVDFALSVVIVGAGFFILFFAAMARERAAVFDAVGPFGFARVVGSAFILLGTILIIRQIRAARAGLPPEAVAAGSEDEPGHPASARRTAAMIAATFAYPILMAPLGYVLTTIGFVVGGMAILSERSWKWIIPIAIVYALGTFYVFASLLNVPLPSGPLTSLFVDLGIVDR